MNFHIEKCFRYQTLLLLMVIHANLAELQEHDHILFSYNFDMSKESAGISFYEFSNKIMAKVYQMFLRLNYSWFQKK